MVGAQVCAVVVPKRVPLWHHGGDGGTWAETMTTGSKTALVFAGGGSLGAVQVGMVKALVAAGVEADLLVGASVGAINAAYLAVHGLGAVGALEAVWRRIRRRDVFPVGVAQALLGLLAMRPSLLSPDPLRALVRREVGGRRFEDARVPLHVVGTDMNGGAEVVLSDGPLLPALMASAAIPGVFPPVEVAGRLLIDGGVANNTPISTAVALGATRVVVLPTGFPCSCAGFPRGALFVAIHALNIAIARQLMADVQRFEDAARLIVVPPLCPLAAAAYAFGLTQELIVRAERATRGWIEGGGLEAREPAPLSIPHGPACECAAPPRHGTPPG